MTVTAPVDIDLATCGALAALLHVPGRDDVVLECSAIEFVDSSGLRVLLEAQSRLAAEGRSLVLLNPSPHLLSLLTLGDLVDMFGMRYEPAPG